MDTRIFTSQQFTLDDEHATDCVEAWTFDELRYCSDLDSMHSAQERNVD